LLFVILQISFSNTGLSWQEAANVVVVVVVVIGVVSTNLFVLLKYFGWGSIFY